MAVSEAALLIMTGADTSLARYVINIVSDCTHTYTAMVWILSLVCLMFSAVCVCGTGTGAGVS